MKHTGSLSNICGARGKVQPLHQPDYLSQASLRISGLETSAAMAPILCIDLCNNDKY